MVVRMLAWLRVYVLHAEYRERRTDLPVPSPYMHYMRAPCVPRIIFLINDVSSLRKMCLMYHNMLRSSTLGKFACRLLPHGCVGVILLTVQQANDMHICLYMRAHVPRMCA